jgi:hypothetical protein
MTGFATELYQGSSQVAARGGWDGTALVVTAAVDPAGSPLLAAAVAAVADGFAVPAIAGARLLYFDRAAGSPATATVTTALRSGADLQLKLDAAPTAARGDAAVIDWPGF